ncbi:MAG: hypothetical protein ACKV2V_13660, partial [Blastocatellia bacterium]
PQSPGLPERVAIEQIGVTLDRNGGAVHDAAGQPLYLDDHKPMHLSNPLWVNLPETGGGGESGGAGLMGAPAAELAFDAVYPITGFDPRASTAPHFALIRAQAGGARHNPAETLAVKRARLYDTIERLKNSFAAPENSLGEMLEEALIAGRLHYLTLHGDIAAGLPVAGSFSFAPA